MINIGKLSLRTNLISVMKVLKLINGGGGGGINAGGWEKIQKLETGMAIWY